MNWWHHMALARGFPAATYSVPKLIEELLGTFEKSFEERNLKYPLVYLD
jgi:hypothetical protein